MKEIGKDQFMTTDSTVSIILSIVNGVCCVFGSLGNMALIAIIALHKKLHGASEFLLMSLALADFVTCAIYLPLLIIRLNANEKLPTIMNQSRRAIGQSTAVCASLNLLMLTADWFIFFYRPLRYAYWIRKKVVIATIVLIYGISLIVGVHAYYDMIDSQYLKMALVGVPMLAFFGLHMAIYRLAAKQRSNVTNQQLSLQHNYKVTSNVMKQAKRNNRTVMLFGILYLMTWLPVTIFQLWISVNDHHDPNTFQKYFYLLLTIQQISSAVDPFLCCYRNNKVKAVLRKLLPAPKTLIGQTTGSTISSLANSEAAESRTVENNNLSKNVHSPKKTSFSKEIAFSNAPRQQLPDVLAVVGDVEQHNEISSTS